LWIAQGEVECNGSSHRDAADGDLPEVEHVNHCQEIIGERGEAKVRRITY